MKSIKKLKYSSAERMRGTFSLLSANMYYSCSDSPIVIEKRSLVRVVHLYRLLLVILQISVRATGPTSKESSHRLSERAC